jgi:hypothetical protein
MASTSQVPQTGPIGAVAYNPALLSEAMHGLKVSIVELRNQFRDPAPQAEARAAIRQKARTGTLKPIRTPQVTSPTGPVGNLGTGRVRTGPELQATVAAAGLGSAELEAVEGWVPLTELAAQNDLRGKQKRR